MRFPVICTGHFVNTGTIPSVDGIIEDQFATECPNRSHTWSALNGADQHCACRLLGFHHQRRSTAAARVCLRLTASTSSRTFLGVPSGTARCCCPASVSVTSQNSHQPSTGKGFGPSTFAIYSYPPKALSIDRIVDRKNRSSVLRGNSIRKSFAILLVSPICFNKPVNLHRRHRLVQH
jgi:hypothetical protein